MEQTANQRMRKTLSQWHTNALKSIGVRYTSEVLSFKLSALSVKQRVFA